MTTDTLYKISNTGAVTFWRITTFYDGEILIDWGVLNGSIQRKTVDVFLNNSNRDIYEQTDLEMSSRIKNQIDAGYCWTIEEAEINKGKNALNLYKPMLAKTYEDVLPTDLSKYFLQFKYDGHRCLITKNDGELIAYSRNGQLFPETLEHILSEIDIDEGVTLDGELYCHGETLQTISSWAKRKQDNSKKLQYICYDMVSNDAYQDRFNMMHDILTYKTKHIRIAPTIRCEVIKLKEAQAQGYEGLILRHEDYPYEIGKRSKGLLKVKSWHSEEFEVLDVVSSKDNWAILVCKLDEHKTFSVSCHGTIGYKSTVLANKFSFIGKFVEVEFANRTKDNVPFHPVAIRWRD